MPSGSQQNTWNSDPRNPCSWPASPKSAARAAAVSFADVADEDFSEVEEENEVPSRIRPVPPRFESLSKQRTQVGTDNGNDEVSWGGRGLSLRPSKAPAPAPDSVFRRGSVPIRRPLPVYPRARHAGVGTGTGPEAASAVRKREREREKEMAPHTQLQNALLSPRHSLSLRGAAPTRPEVGARDSIACSNEYYLLESPQLKRQQTTIQVPSTIEEKNAYNRKSSGQEADSRTSSTTHLKLLRGCERLLSNQREDRSGAKQASQKPVSYV